MTYVMLKDTNRILESEVLQLMTYVMLKDTNRILESEVLHISIKSQVPQSPV